MYLRAIVIIAKHKQRSKEIVAEEINQANSATAVS
jgi:hypothetical protein